MSTMIRPAPVRKSIYVAASPEHSFDVFANHIGEWWPKSHHTSKADLDRPVLEPCPGGRWYELAIDGEECEVGKVLAWDPPHRLLLAWQLRHDFTYDPALITEVEVTFAPEGDGTRVNLEHRNLERLGDNAQALRESIDSPNGWGLLLQLYSEAATD